MYVVTEQVNISGRNGTTYNFIPGDVGTMSMKFSRYPHLEFNMNPEVIQQLTQQQMELIKDAEDKLTRLQNKPIKVDGGGWNFSHVRFVSNPDTVLAVCEKKVSKYISLNEVKEQNKTLFEPPGVAIKPGKSYIAVKPANNLFPGMVGTFDSNDNYPVIKFHPIKIEHWVGEDQVGSLVRDGTIRELTDAENADIAEADKLRGKTFSMHRTGGKIEPGWTLSYVVGYIDTNNNRTDDLQIKCSSPITKKNVDYSELLRMNPSEGGRLQKRAQRRSKFKRTSNYLTLKSKSKSKTKSKRKT